MKLNSKTLFHRKTFNDLVCFEHILCFSKIKHMWKRRGTPSNFCLAFIDELEKQVLKKLLKWINKKFRILIFKMLHLKKKKKVTHTHTCEEGGVHIRISIWHLLMNLKNKHLLKKLLKWANKKQNFNIYNVVFKKKKKNNLNISLFYTCVPKI